MDEEQFTTFIFQFMFSIVACFLVFVALIKKCGRKTDWELFISVVKQADYFRTKHRTKGDMYVGGFKDWQPGMKPLRKEGMFVGGVFSIMFVGMFSGFLFVAFVMYNSFNTVSSQVLMPKYAQAAYALATDFKIDIEVVGFTGCINGSMTTEMYTDCNRYDCCAAYGINDYYACVENAGGAYDFVRDSDPTVTEMEGVSPETEGATKVELQVNGLCADRFFSF